MQCRVEWPCVPCKIFLAALCETRYATSRVYHWRRVGQIATGSSLYGRKIKQTHGVDDSLTKRNSCLVKWNSIIQELDVETTLCRFPADRQLADHLPFCKASSWVLCLLGRSGFRWRQSSLSWALYYLHSVKKKHPFSLSYISLREILRFTQRLQEIYWRNYIFQQHISKHQKIVRLLHIPTGQCTSYRARCSYMSSRDDWDACRGNCGLHLTDSMAQTVLIECNARESI